MNDLSELTLTVLRYGFLILIWILVISVVSALRRDLETLTQGHGRPELASTLPREQPEPLRASQTNTDARRLRHCRCGRAHWRVASDPNTWIPNKWMECPCRLPSPAPQ